MASLTTNVQLDGYAFLGPIGWWCDNGQNIYLQACRSLDYTVNSYRLYITARQANGTVLSTDVVVRIDCLYCAYGNVDVWASTES